MEIKIRNYVPKFQEGGAMEEQPPVQEQPMDAGGEDPTAQLLQAATAAVQNQDCQLALEVLAQLLQMAGGDAEAPQAPADQAPVYRTGGKLAGWVRK